MVKTGPIKKFKRSDHPLANHWTQRCALTRAFSAEDNEHHCTCMFLNGTVISACITKSRCSECFNTFLCSWCSVWLIIGPSLINPSQVSVIIWSQIHKTFNLSWKGFSFPQKCYLMLSHWTKPY